MLIRSRSSGRISVLALLFVILTPAVAAAAKRLVVLPVEGAGKKDAAIAAKITATLKQHKVKVAPAATLKKALKKRGAPSSGGDWVKLARRLKVDGFVESTLSNDGGKRQVEVRIRNGADGEVTGRQTFTTKGPPKRLATVVGKWLWDSLGSAIGQTSISKREKKEPGAGLPARDLPAAETSDLTPPPFEGRAESPRPSPAPAARKSRVDSAAAEKAGKAEKAEAAAAPEGKDEEERPDKKLASSGGGARDEDEREEQKAAPAATGPLPPLEVEADLRVLRRVFEYVPTTAGRSYVLNFYTPVVGGRAAWFPIKYLGIFAAGEMSLALETGQYPTETRELIGGVQFRMPFSFGQVGATAAYFQHSFLIRDTADPNDASRLELQVPNTVYVGARFGAAARFRIGGNMQAGVDVAYRLVTSAGGSPGQVKSAQYFPGSAAPIGVDAGAFIGYRLRSWLEIRGGLDYRRYAFGRLQSGPGSSSVIDATGALDQYVALFGGAAGIF